MCKFANKSCFTITIRQLNYRLKRYIVNITSRIKVINRRPTYHLLVSMFFALLLINAFVYKELHYLLEASHGHEHHLVDRHADCNSTTHFHAFDYQSNCSICDFNFSPREFTDTQMSELWGTVTYNSFRVYNQVFRSENTNLLPYLRGPPIHFS